MGPGRIWVDFGGGRGLHFLISSFGFHMNDSAFRAVLCIFITVFSTLGKGREGKKITAAVFCGQRKKTENGAENGLNLKL